MVIGEAEMVPCIEPAVVGVAQGIEGSDIDHGSVSHRRGVDAGMRAMWGPHESRQETPM
jgi:hypothetical protein